MSDDIRWLSTKKAAARLGVTPRTLYRFIDEGQIPAYRMGRVIRLREAEVDAYLESCRIEPGTLDHLYPEGPPDSGRVNGDVDEVAPASEASSSLS